MRVEVPDYGTFVEFPDDMPQEHVHSVLAAHFPSTFKLPETLDEYIAVKSTPEGREKLRIALKRPEAI